MNKKILILPSWYPTPSSPIRGSFFQEQAFLLQKEAGFDIQVLYGEKKSKPLIQWIKIFLSSLWRKSWAISKERVQQGPKAYGFEIPVNRRVDDARQIRLEKQLYWKAYQRLISSGWVPDLIHAQSGMDAGIYAHHISEMTGIPFVIMEHQVFVFHYYSRLRSASIMNAFKVAHRIAAVSEDERRQVMMNQPECNPQVIWNLVDESRYRIDLSKRNKDFTVITLLNSLPIKGALDFLEAMALVTQQDPSIRFVMIGKGGDKSSKDPSENLFIRKSRELGILEYGDFLPFVARESISDVLNQAHVFVSPTIQEPHGIAVREAMMCGLPVVSTANGGVEDSITLETGVVVPVCDAEKMANAILRMSQNHHHFKPDRIRELAISQCGKEVFKAKMSRFYKIG